MVERPRIFSRTINKWTNQTFMLVGSTLCCLPHHASFPISSCSHAMLSISYLRSSLNYCRRVHSRLHFLSFSYYYYYLIKKRHLNRKGIVVVKIYLDMYIFITLIYLVKLKLAVGGTSLDFPMALHSKRVYRHQ